MLPGFVVRPQHHCVNKKDSVENITSTSNALFLFIRGCENLVVNVTGKVGKVTIENGTGVTLNLDNNVVGGTLEVIRCTNTTLNFQQHVEVPIIQADDSTGLNVNILSREQIEAIVFTRTADVKLMLKDQQVGDENGLTLEFVIDSPNDDVQRVTHWSSADPHAHTVTEPVVRDGIYPTTAEMKKACEEKRELMKEKMAEMLLKGIKITRPQN